MVRIPSYRTRCMERLTMYSRGIEVGRSSNDATPSVKANVERTMRLTWRATMRPISLFCRNPAPTRASPTRSLRSFFRYASACRYSSAVMRPWATSVSPSRSFFMLLAAKMARPLSKKIVFTARPDCTWRSPLRRPAASWRSGSAIGVTERSVSITADLGYHGGRRRHNPAPRSGCAVPQDQAGRAPAAPAGTGQRDADRVPARRGVEQHQLARRGKLGLGARPSFQPGFRVPPSAASDVELQLAPGESRGIAQLQLDPGDRDLAAELEAQEVARAL